MRDVNQRLFGIVSASPIAATAVIMIRAIVIMISLLASAIAWSDSLITGLWAMTPLRNGIANVIEYTTDGESINHPFICMKGGQVQSYPLDRNNYVVRDGLIHVSNKTTSFDMTILDLKPGAMTVRDRDSGLVFKYTRVSKVKPNCAAFWRSTL